MGGKLKIIIIVLSISILLGWYLYPEQLNESLGVIKSEVNKLSIYDDDVEEIFSIGNKINTTSLEIEIHNLINIERQKYSVKGLILDQKLSIIARGHSKDMAENNFFEHDNLRGESPTDRAKAKGYSCYKDYGLYYTDGIAENIFQNNLYDSLTVIIIIPIFVWNSQTDIALSTVEGWMNSPGHRENILESDYDKGGLGIAISGYKIYITQNFC